MSDTKRAIVLSSGGLDSTTCMALAAQEGYELIALTLDYGQRHRVELEAAARVCAHYDAEQLLVSTELFRKLGGSALTDDLDVPKHSSADELGDEVPVTYVPARNLVMLSLATAAAEARGCEAIYIGVNALDYSGYPDCRPEFIEAFQLAAQRATKVGGVRIETPLIHLTKAEIVLVGLAAAAPLELSHSCYAPDEAGRSCGRCDSCLLRLRGFKEAGYEDLIEYVPCADIRSKRRFLASRARGIGPGVSRSSVASAAATCGAVERRTEPAQSAPSATRTLSARMARVAAGFRRPMSSLITSSSFGPGAVSPSSFSRVVSPVCRWTTL